MFHDSTRGRKKVEKSEKSPNVQNLKKNNTVLYTEKSVMRVDFMLSILATKKEQPKLYMDYKIIYVF